MGHGLHSTSFTIKKHLRNSSLYTSTRFVEPHATPVTANPLFRAIAIPIVPHFGHIAALYLLLNLLDYLLLNLYERNHLHHLNLTTDSKLQGQHHQFLSLELLDLVFLPLPAEFFFNCFPSLTTFLRSLFNCFSSLIFFLRIVSLLSYVFSQSSFFLASAFLSFFFFKSSNIASSVIQTVLAFNVALRLLLVLGSGQGKLFT